MNIQQTVPSLKACAKVFDWINTGENIGLYDVIFSINVKKRNN